MITILTPAFNEAQNLPALYERLCQTMMSVDMEWEWLIADDHSRDETFTVVCRLAQQDRRVRGIRFARNFALTPR
jgi:dolichol-phosphate mannosyltransferase